MKPSRNRVMCPDCMKQKMLFETQRKAEDFIKWNGDSLDVTHIHLRAYYCPACCGWHISHKKYWGGYEERTDKMVEAYQRSSHKKKKIDRLIACDFAGDAKRIWNEIPEEVRCAEFKSQLRDYINVYYAEHGIEDKGGYVRGEIYKLWRNKQES